MKKGKSVQQYLDNARRQVHNSYNHADGQFVDTGSFAKNAFSGYRNASGGAGAAVPTSQPYVINVTSISAAAVNDFDILGSYEYLFGGVGTWSAGGDLTIGSITISSGMPGVTYRQMLAQFQNVPFTVGMTYYQSATANQIQQSLQVVKKDANGNESKRPVVPAIDPYQQQSTVLALNDVFTVDGYTKITIRQVLANASITFMLYPADNINVARGLESNAVSKDFADPGIVKAQKLVVE